jgi:hypothetical protein
MNVTPTGIDFAATIFILILVVISGFTLLGTGVLMAIGAVFSKRPLVTSWPNEQEHTFAPFERRGASANALAWVFSLAGGVLITLLAIGIYFGVAPERRDVTKDMNMSNLTKRRSPAAAAAAKPDAPAPAEAAKPAAPAPAEAAKPDTQAPAPAEAPKQ